MQQQLVLNVTRGTYIRETDTGACIRGTYSLGFISGGLYPGVYIQGLISGGLYTIILKFRSKLIFIYDMRLGRTLTGTKVNIYYNELSHHSQICVHLYANLRQVSYNHNKGNIWKRN